MQTAAVYLFYLVLAGTAAMVPLCYSVGAERGPASWAAWIWIVLAGLGRGLVAGLGMVLLAMAGRWDGMVSGRGLQIVAGVGAVVVVELAASYVNVLCAMAVGRGLGSGAVLAAVGVVVSAALAVAGLAAGWGRVEAGWLLAGSIGLAMAGGVGSYLYVNGESTGYVTELGKETREIDKLRGAKGMEAVLSFLTEGAGEGVQRAATERLAEIPGIEDELLRALRGPQKVLAMKAVARHAGLRKDGEARAYWEAAAGLAEELRTRGIRDGEEARAVGGLVAVLVYEDAGFEREARAVERFAVTMETRELETLVGMYLRKN